MSVRAEVSPIQGRYAATIVAVAAALAIGAFVGSLVTQAVSDRSTTASTVTAPLWDAQRLEAMEGRVLAERYRSEQVLTWDTQKLEAMAGRVLYEPVAVELEAAATAKPSSTRPAIEGWDAGKLEAMQGRALAG